MPPNINKCIFLFLYQVPIRQIPQLLVDRLLKTHTSYDYRIRPLLPDDDDYFAANKVKAYPNDQR